MDTQRFPSGTSTTSSACVLRIGDVGVTGFCECRRELGSMASRASSESVPLSDSYMYAGFEAAFDFLGLEGSGGNVYCSGGWVLTSVGANMSGIAAWPRIDAYL